MRPAGVGQCGPSTCACDLRELLIVPLRTQGYCGVGGASQDSAGFGAMEDPVNSRHFEIAAKGDLRSTIPSCLCRLDLLCEPDAWCKLHVFGILIWNSRVHFPSGDKMALWCCCLENCMDGGAWRAVVCEATERRTRPSHRPENPAGSTYSSTTGLSPLKQ